MSRASKAADRFHVVKLLREAVLFLARLGPLGSLPAPGTWGSAAGVGFYAVVFHGFNRTGRYETFALIAALSILFATAVCHFAEYFLKKKDPGEVILDEFVAMPLVFVGFRHVLDAAQHAWAWYIAGFLLFRLFDIAKPFGIRGLQRVGGGFGIVIDDVLAAVYAAITLQLAHWLVSYLR